MKKTKANNATLKRRPALTPEARENQMISLAVDLAEKQLVEGTASAQVITHYLKLATVKEKIERDILEKRKGLLDAQTQALQSAQHMEKVYEEALEAMKKYSGHGDDDDD